MLLLMADAEPVLHFAWWTADQWSVAASVSTVLAAVGALIGIGIAVAQLVLSRQASVEQSLPYVVATADTELSHSRDLRLRIENYGATIAFDVEPRFPEAVFTPDGQLVEFVPLPISVLAPSQVVHRWVTLAQEDVDETGALRAPVSVAYEDWRGQHHKHDYELVSMRSASTAREIDPAMRLADSVEVISRTLQGAMSPDRRSVIVETRGGMLKRVFGMHDTDDDQP